MRGNAAFAWFIMLTGIGAFGLIYIALDPVMDKVALNTTLFNHTNSTAQKIQGYQNTFWYLLPLSMLIALGLWGFIQAQKPELGV